MTRLQSHRQKDFQKKMGVYAILLIGLVFFMLTVGIKLMINASLFIGNLGSPEAATPLQKNTDFYGRLSIDNIPEATNSAKLIVAGSATQFDKIEFYINDKKVKEESATDSFSEEIGNLKSGNNIIYVKATTKDGKQKKVSEKFTVTYKSSKPKLELKEPSDGAKTKSSEIKIAGSTNNEVFIKVNGLPLIVNSLGEFQTNYTLREGDNAIAITAEDNAGNTETKNITVTREKDE